MSGTTNLHPLASKVAPGPEAPLTIDIIMESQQIIARLLKKYGDIVKLNDEKRKSLSYIITNPDAIKYILINNHDNYQKGAGFEHLKILLGDGILISDGDYWRRQRTMIQPAFTRKNILRFCTIFKTETQALVEKWKYKAENNGSIDITEETSFFSLQVILRALIGDDLDLLTAEHGENPFEFLAADRTRDLTVAIKFRQLGKLIQKIIDTRRGQSIKRDDLLDTLMDATDKSGNRMPDNELIDEVLTLIIAGHETTAGTLNWVWYELSQHPDAEQKAWMEAGSYVNENSIETDDLPKLKFIKQCINEALRLYPPVWLFSRKAIKDDEVMGYSIPAGTNIFLSPYFTHRDPALWDKPESFHPEHFDENGSLLKHKHSFIPFSAGSRRCLGEYFSYVEMQTHLAILLKRFKLELLPGQTIELQPDANLLRTKNNIMMKISLR